MTHLDTKSEPSVELDEHIIMLQKVEMRILGLEDELDAAQKEYSSIQRHIAVLRASRAPIRRLPREILIMVFENHSEDQRCRNASLLLVCKLWYDIVTNTPSLWSNIILNMVRVETIPLAWKYVDTCIRRSRQHRLDIWINATNFKPVEYGSYDLDEDLSIQYPYGISTYSYDGDSGFDNIWDRRMDADTRVYEHGIYLALGVLRGEDDKYIGRWGSLRIDFCNRLPRGAIPNILQGLGNGPCNLDTLDIRTSAWYGMEGVETTPFMTTVSRLVVGFSAKLSPQRSYSAQHLVIMNSTSISAFETWGSSCFQHIQSLELHDDKGSRLGTPQTGIIILPYLKCLAIARPYRLSSFELPKLTHLFVRYVSYATDFPSHILSLVTDFRYPWYAHELSRQLKPMVLMMPRLERLHLGGVRNCSYGDLGVALEEVRGEVDTLAICLDDPNGNEWPVKLEIA